MTVVQRVSWFTELANLRGFEPVHDSDISENKIYQLEEMGDK